MNSQRIAETVASNMQRKVWWSSRADAVQEAHLAIQQARSTYNAGIGVPFDAYAYRAATLAVRRATWRDSAPVSGGMHRPEESRAGLHRAPIKESAMPKQSRTPEDALHGARVRHVVRMRLLALLEAMPGAPSCAHRRAAIVDALLDCEESTSAYESLLRQQLRAAAQRDGAVLAATDKA